MQLFSEKETRKYILNLIRNLSLKVKNIQFKSSE